MTKQYPKIKAALSRESGVAWAVVDAIGAEVDVTTERVGRGQLAEVATWLKAEGVEFAASTLTKRAAVARFMGMSTAEQSDLFRGCAVETICRFVSSSWSPEAVADVIRAHPARRLTSTEARSLLSGARPTYDPPAPEDRTDDEWEAYDRSVLTAAATIVEAQGFQRQGLYTPSATTAAALALLFPGEVDWDAALAELGQ